MLCNYKESKIYYELCLSNASESYEWERDYNNNHCQSIKSAGK